MRSPIIQRRVSLSKDLSMFTGNKKWAFANAFEIRFKWQRKRFRQQRWTLEISERNTRHAFFFWWGLSKSNIMYCLSVSLLPRECLYLFNCAWFLHCFWVSLMNFIMMWFIVSSQRNICFSFHVISYGKFNGLQMNSVFLFRWPLDYHIFLSAF